MKIVNLLIIAIFATTIISCSSDNSPNYTTEMRPITEVNVPDSVTLGKDNKFKITYEKWDNCEEFAGFDVQLDNNEGVEDNTFSVYAIVYAYFGEECSKYETPKTATSEIKFQASDKEPYHFKFWQSNDTTQSPAVPKYLEKTIIVKDKKGSDDTDE